jgi:aspartate/methionine/tyrosine aminotransferase
MASMPDLLPVSPLPPFKLERFFAEYEFKVRYLLSASDCESLTLHELLLLSDSDSLARWQRLSLSYTESQGDPTLRAEIVRQYPGLGPEDVVVMVPEEAIYIAMQTLVQPGDHVIAIHPAYQSLHEIARARGCTVTPWEVRPTGDGRGWQLDLDDLAAAITPKTRLLVINFPHNPTGHLPPRESLDAIVGLAQRHDLYLFSDEMYRGLEYDPARRLPAVCTLYEKGISLSGLSKTLAAPGLRLGWLATRAPGLVERWLAYKDYTTICHSAPSEVLGLMALRAEAQILQRNLDIIAANLALVDGFFQRHANRFGWPPPLAGSVAFPEWRGEGTVEAFCQGVLDEKGVLLVPGTIFDVPGRRFRLGLGRRSFADGLARLEEYVATT